MKLYYVYVIESKEGFIYKGMTDNLEKRLVEHNNKTLSFWTKRGTNWKLIYNEEWLYSNYRMIEIKQLFLLNKNIAEKT
ncbi:MAG: GIY-YIG nuclease family protein [Bacteroidetes bacterium]|nr:GIY-YIG nuclease family protein [Bacteroidota bacterium]